MIEKTYPGLRDFPPNLTQLATRGTWWLPGPSSASIDPALLSLEKKLQKPQVREQLESGRHPAQSEEGMAIFFLLVRQIHRLSVHMQQVKAA